MKEVEVKLKGSCFYIKRDSLLACPQIHVVYTNTIGYYFSRCQARITQLTSSLQQHKCLQQA